MPIPKQQPLFFNQLGGMQTHLPENNYPNYGAVIARNCRINAIGEVTRRKGSSKYYTSQIDGIADIQGLYNFRYYDTQVRSQFLINTNGKLFKSNGITAPTSLKTGLSTTAYSHFETYDNFCWITNGVDANMKYDGTTVTNLSIDKPTTDLTGTASSGGSLSAGTYRYTYTFYNSTTGQESNPYTLNDSGCFSITVTAGQKVDLTSIDVSTDPQVNARRIYRSTVNSTILNAQLVGTISNNSATTFTDTVADTALGRLVPVDYDTPPIFKKLVIHNNKGVGYTGKDSILYVSKENNAWYYPQAQLDPTLTANDFTIAINDGDGDYIVDIVSYYSSLLIFKQNSVWILDGYDQTDFSVRRVEFERNVGCISSRAAIVWRNWCYFLDRNGIYRTNGQGIEYIGEAMEAFFNPSNIQSEEKVNPELLVNAVATLEKTKPNNLIRFSMPSSSSSVNDLHLIVSGETDQWLYDTGYKASSYATLNIDNTHYTMRGDTYGFVWYENQIEGDGGLIYSTVTSSSNTTLVDTLQSFTVDTYIGCWVEILAGTGAGQRRFITDNDATSITVSQAWDTNPDTTSTYTIGGIDFMYVHKWDNYGVESISKRLKYIELTIDNLGSYAISTFAWYDFVQTTETDESTSLKEATIWDDAVFDENVFDSEFVNQQYVRTLASKIHNYSAVGIKHKPAGQPVIFKGYSKIYQLKGFINK